MISIFCRIFAASTVLLLTVAPPLAFGLTIVDIVTDSDESAQNSEPSIALNPANPGEVFITALNEPDKVSLEPQPAFVFFSGDGGSNWSVYQQIETLDFSLAWADGGKPYLAQLFEPDLASAASVLVRSAELPAANSHFELIPAGTYAGFDGTEQPWVVASRSEGQDRVYVTYNDFNAYPRTASIQFSLDSGATWTRTILERQRPGVDQDGPAVRAAVSGDTVYVVFQRWQGFETVGFDAGVATGELVVVKDTDAGRNGFRALGPAGVGAIPQGGLTFPFGFLGLGQQRIGSGLSIAVDPNDANVLFVATEVYEDGAPHIVVFQSTDGGREWCHCFETRPHTALPALAIAANGTIGLEYTGAFNGLLETHLLQTPDRFLAVADVTLSRFIDASLQPAFDPFIGDYQRLVAVGNIFYGTFAASNDTSLFPTAPTFQRDRSRLGTRVNYSIDPFYFSTPAITSAPTALPPVALDDQVTFQSQFGVEINVLANDSDPSGETVSLLAVGKPNAGRTVIKDSGKIEYNAGANFTGNDSFTYTIANGVGKTATARVNVRNPFFSVRGTFSGLVKGDISLLGLLKGNLLHDGQFTGKLLLVDEAHTLRGTFDLGGDFVAVIRREEADPLTIRLHLDFKTGLIEGFLSNATFDPEIRASLSSFTFDNRAPQEGSYTFALRRGITEGSGELVIGSGFGQAIVKYNGVVRLAGKLPDGTPFSTRLNLLNSGILPLYIPLPKSTLLGEITFANQPDDDFTGLLNWIHPRPDSLFDAIFFNLEVVGSRYTPPDRGARVFLNENTGSGSGFGIAEFATAQPARMVFTDFRLTRSHHAFGLAPTPRDLTFAINPLTGLFSGTFNPPGPTTVVRIKGAILQKSNTGAGFFLDAGQSNLLLLRGKP